MRFGVALDLRVRAWLCVALATFAVVEAQDARRPNVLFVTIDALRADRVNPALTPTLTAIGGRGTRFTRAYTHAPLTLPAHASLLTGLVPPAHGVRSNGFRLDGLVITLPELLRAAGYRTGAFIGGSALDARFGLAQGFEEYDDRYDLLQDPTGSNAFRHGARPASAVLAATAAWIARQPEPWFAWSHLRDPHSPTAGPPYASYDRAVAAADMALGAFLEPLAAGGMLARTLIVVTADHGASLGEHGERSHGVFAYEGVLRVPLVVAGPGVPRAEVRLPVSHADVMPTVLELLRLTLPASDGQSLVAAMRGGEMDARAIYFEALDPALARGGAPLTGVVAGQWKFIDLPIPELYDVLADPEEKANRAAGEPAMATRLRDTTVRRRTASTRADAALSLAEPAARATLRSLGYVGSASWRLGASRVEDDPKRLLPLHLAYEAALEIGGTDPEAALHQLRLILEQRPDFAAAIDAAGALLVAQGKPRQAITLLRDARAGGLRHRVLAERLAAALLAVKDPRGAVEVMEPVVEAEDAAADARFLLARGYAALGKGGAAIEQLEAALQIDPTFTAASDLLQRLRKR